MTVKSIRVTEYTHELLSTLANVLKVTQSEALESAVETAYPEVVEEVKRREQAREKIAKGKIRSK